MNISPAYATRADLTRARKWRFTIEDKIATNKAVTVCHRQCHALPYGIRFAIGFPIVFAGFLFLLVGWLVGDLCLRAGIRIVDKPDGTLDRFPFAITSAIFLLLGFFTPNGMGWILVGLVIACFASSWFSHMIARCSAHSVWRQSCSTWSR